MINKFLDLGIQPLANRYLTKKDIIKKNKEQFYHLEVGFDSKTKLVSIINKVSSKKCSMITIHTSLRCPGQ